MAVSGFTSVQPDLRGRGVITSYSIHYTKLYEIRSVTVVLPASMCAMIPMFRTLSAWAISEVPPEQVER